MVLLPCVVLLSACGSGGARGVTGDYTCTESLLDALTLSSGAKAYATATLFGATLQKSGTYEVDGERVVVKIDPPFPLASMVFTKSGDTLDGGVNGRCTKR